MPSAPRTRSAPICAGEPAAPRDVADDDGVGVVHRLQLQQRAAAAGLVWRIGAMQHEPFATRLQHLVETTLQRCAVDEPRLFDRDQLGAADPDGQRVELRGPRRERSGVHPAARTRGS